MKKQTLILTILLTLLCGAVAANAQLSLTFSPDTQTGAPGSTVTFSGTLDNTGPSTLFLNSDSFTLIGSGLTLDDTKFFTNAPLSLGPGTSTGLIELFDVAIDPSTGLGSFPGSFTVQGGTDPGASDALAITPFTVLVAAPAGNTPEPGAMALLIGMGVSGSLLALRRLRRR